MEDDKTDPRIEELFEKFYSDTITIKETDLLIELLQNNISTKRNQITRNFMESENRREIII